MFLLDNQSLIPLSIYTLNRNGNTLEQHVKWEDCVPFCWILPLPRDSILILMLLLPAMSKVRERQSSETPNNHNTSLSLSLSFSLYIPDILNDLLLCFMVNLCYILSSISRQSQSICCTINILFCRDVKDTEKPF